MMRYKTVLFDADGTLLDFLRSEREAVKEAFAISGIDASDEMISVYSAINDSLWKKLERKEIERSVLLYHRFELFCERYGYVADAKKIAADYVKTLGTKGYMLDGAEEMLKKLHGKVRMYIVTNGVESVQRQRYGITGLSKYFDGIFISEAIGVNKPDPRYFEYVAAHIEGFDKATTIVVGDSLSSDIKGGVNFGLDTCWYSPDGADANGVSPTYTVRSFDELCDILLYDKEDIS